MDSQTIVIYFGINLIIMTYDIESLNNPIGLNGWTLTVRINPSTPSKLLFLLDADGVYRAKSGHEKVTAQELKIIERAVNLEIRKRGK